MISDWALIYTCILFFALLHADVINGAKCNVLLFSGMTLPRRRHMRQGVSGPLSTSICEPLEVEAPKRH